MVVCIRGVPDGACILADGALAMPASVWKISHRKGIPFVYRHIVVKSIDDDWCILVSGDGVIIGKDCGVVARCWRSS